MTKESADETDQRRARVWALNRALRAQGYVSEVAESEPLLCVVADGASMVIRCDRRATEGGALWFHSPEGHPIAPADTGDLSTAITAVEGRLARRDAQA